MFKNFFEKQFKKLFATKGADALKSEITPYRDWKIVVMSFAAGFAILLGLNIYMLVQINNDNFFTTVPKKFVGPSLDSEGLAKVLSSLAEKEALIHRPIGEGKLVVDPSR